MNEWLGAALGLGEGGTPFPWQEELLNRFVQGVIPPALDIPTGLGKTAVMAIWLVARASGAQLPRRLVYVVDRRAVVDQATTEAERLRAWVERTEDAKRALGLARALPISTLRGQHVDNREWLEDPSAPAIIVGTIDMVGSRLLFEGYGVSRKMRSYHAGLLGADTLLVLDEAHLVPPFERLLATFARDESNAFGPGEPVLRAYVPRFELLPLSATGREVEGALELTPDDLGHPIVHKRLRAKKHLCLHSLEKEEKLEEMLARRAWELSRKGESAVRCIVFCDERRVAEKAKKIIDGLAKGDKKGGEPAVKIDSGLFVGGRRVLEREQAKEQLERLGFIAGSTGARTRPAFLFATSAGEVGVDLDADHMVCDLVAWERMVQRLGRVNRRGEPDHCIAQVDVVVEQEPDGIEDLMNKGPDQRTLKERHIVDRAETKRAARRMLEHLSRTDGDRFNASPGALRDVKKRVEVDPDLRALLDAATTTEPLRPALSRALVDAWSMTSLQYHAGRPAVAPWLRGWIKDEPQTSIVWRTCLPVRGGGARPTAKEIEGFFEAAPPHASEILETETFHVVTWLIVRAETLLRPRSVASSEETKRENPPLRSEDVVAFVLARDGALRRTLRLDDLALPEDKKEARERREDLHEALVEATVLVDSRLGGLNGEGLLDSAETDRPRTVDDGGPWLGEGAVRFRVRSLQANESLAWNAHWRERMRFAVDLSDDGEASRWLIVEKWRHDAATEEDRSAARPQLLDEHESWAEERARSLAKALGLDEYAEMLGVAARLHDEGKVARRWQRAFNAPRDGLYAKTKGPINYALLDGYRHELGSLLRVLKDRRLLALSEEQQELALHLIAAHHGFARPVIGTSGCDDAPPSMLKDRAREIALRFVRLQERWGPWGLAWWEALLRAADQQASRDNDALDAAGGYV